MLTAKPRRPRRRNPEARALACSLFRPRVKASAKAYRRRPRNRNRQDETA